VDSRHVAVVEAKRILGTYRPPAGAVRLAAAPKSVLIQPALGSAANRIYQIDDVEWWSVPRGNAHTIVTKTPVPAGSTYFGSANGGTADGAVEYGIAFGWPVIDGVLTERSLEVSAQADHGRILIRADGIATWIPPRDPKSFIPVSATAVTVTFRAGPLVMPTPTPKPFGPVTTTDPAQVAAIVAAVNAAPVDNSGRHSCPAASGGHMTVAFQVGAAGPVVATAEIETTGCDNIGVSVPGGADASLAGGRGLSAAIAKIIKEPWPTQ
jgi:hypothetical protein